MSVLLLVTLDRECLQSNTHGPILAHINRSVTHSAAIYGLRSKKDISIFILHPKGRVSPIQEAQMTTVMDENVFNLAVEGTFDDCQVSASSPSSVTNC